MSTTWSTVSRHLDAKKVALARAMHADKTVAISDICAALGVSRTTLYRYLATSPGRRSGG